jgi:hypothetical protein
MSPEGVRFSRPVFTHIVGTYKRIVEFDEYGHAELRFRIRKGRARGHHFLWLEPWLLARRRFRRKPAHKLLQPTSRASKKAQPKVSSRAARG